nr:ribonuclease H-like domain-containing protein [Tanacetum cinerariifolium]
MITRSQSGIVKPINCLSLHTFSVSPIFKNPSHALKDPNWCNAMYDEYNALVKNDTWLLVPRPVGVNMVRSTWLFKHKFHADGTLSRYKARLVANGSSHKLGVDFDETFSLVVKPATIRTVLSLVVSHDIILIASCLALLQQIIGSLNNELDMTDLGALNYFLGISVDRTPTGLFLSQKKYALQLLKHAHMVTCNPSQKPVDTVSKLGLKVQQICLYMHDPREPHLDALKRILRYVQGTLDLGLHLYASFTTSLVGYTDADWVGYPSTRSVEAEYRGVANVVAETTWLWNLLRELHSPLSIATLVYCDNVRVIHVPSHFQYADIFTKGLPSALFEEFRSCLSEIEFHIELVHEAILVAKSPYRLTPSEMEELSGQIKKLQDKGSQYFSNIHLSSEYHLLRMHEDGIPKIAFRTHYGHFELTVMPFGLTNAPVTREEHEVHPGLVLELLKKEKLYDKFSKCEFWLQEVQILRHVINGDGIHVDPSKIEAVKN